MNAKTSPTISVSTVTPVFAGRNYLPELAAGLDILKQGWDKPDCPVRLIEALFVDDGSVDGSTEILLELSEKYSWIRVISLSRNYGQHAATVAGICHTSSDWIVTLDEDLQHKPGMINQLFECQVSTGADVIYANPISAVHGRSWRDTASRLLKRVVAKMTSTPQIKMFNSFRLIRGSIARAAASSSSSNTYFDIAVSWFTKSCAAIELNLFDGRFVDNSESGYSFMKLLRHARRLVISSELDIASSGLVLGFSTVIFATFIALLSFLQRVFFPEAVGAAGWTSLVIVFTFFSGVIIALLCIALEYLNIIVLNNLGRPTFFTVDRNQDQLLLDWFSKRL